MSRFSVNVEGLDEVRAMLDSKELDKRIKLGMGNALRQIHNVLKSAVFETYNRPNNLEKALVKTRTTSSLKQAENFISMGLTYEDSGTRLFEFPHVVEEVTPSAIPWIPVPNLYMSGFKNGRMPWDSKVQQITVSVKRGSSTTLSPGISFKGAFIGTVNKKKEILVRAGNETWKRFPNEDDPEGERALYFRLKGPNLVQMASFCYDNDPKVIDEVLNASSYIQAEIFRES